MLLFFLSIGGLIIEKDIDHVIMVSANLNKMLMMNCIIAQEAANNDNGQAPHSAWRNYDDFNEYFW